MTRVAIVGTGVAGLSAAYSMRGEVDIVMFEKDDRVGGHASTVEVEEDGERIGIDTAFVTFNGPDYPRFGAFLEETGVAWGPQAGGFTFFDRLDGIQYGSDDFALDREALESRYPARVCSLIEQARRFHRESGRHLRTGEAELPLAEYLERHGYSDDFRDAYVGLLAMGVWSIPPAQVWTMPASTVITFFFYHGVGGLGGTRLSWRTIKGGCISYVRRLLEIVQPEVRMGVEVLSVEDAGDQVLVRTAQGIERFDYAVVAAHADDACRILTGAATEAQRQLLSVVGYNDVHVVLHRDETVMPEERASWRTWNYGTDVVDGVRTSWVTYYMNLVQALESRRDYFITLDYPSRQDSIICEFAYRHPIIDMQVHTIQDRIYSLNDMNRIKLCGTYFHARGHVASIGFHEAGFSSGADAGASVLAMKGED